MLIASRIVLAGTPLLLAATSPAGIIDVPGGQPTIQTAINAASGGDVVLVAAGVYSETLDLVGKPITVRSVDGPEVTILDGFGFSDSVITCNSGEGADTVIQGFTVTRGSGSPNLFGSGGGMLINNTAPTVIDCVFRNNTALYGGGIEIFGAGSPTVIACRFERNTANSSGGGVDVLGATPVLINCLFFDNAGGQGGGLANVGANTTAINCSFSGNDGNQRGGGIYSSSGSVPVLTNCIFAGNVAFMGPEIFNNVSAGTIVASSNILGSGGSAAWNPDFGIDAGGNIDADPLFVAAGHGDLHLRPGSPSINAGDSGAVPPEITTDLDGGPRIAGAAVDMGAYESPAPPCTGDTDGNGQVDIDDVINVVLDFGTDGSALGGDVDGSGLVDIDDVVLVVLSVGPCI